LRHLSYPHTSVSSEDPWPVEAELEQSAFDSSNAEDEATTLTSRGQARRHQPNRPPASVSNQSSGRGISTWWFLITFVCLLMGLGIYWRDLKTAAFVTAGWFFVLFIFGASRIALFVLINMAFRIFHIHPKTGRHLFLPAIVIFAAASVWRIAPFVPFVDSAIDNAIKQKLSSAGPHYIFYASNGTEVLSEGTRLVGPDEIWQSHLRAAIIDIEDERHPDRDIPIDPKSVVRAAYRNFTSTKQEGASTIQVQMVDLLFNDLANKWLNKLFEWLITLRLDARIPDRAVQLSVYCNIVPGSDNGQGVASLAADLFNVSDLRSLSPSQAAVIAASLKGSDYNPRVNRQKATQRRDLVLTKMHTRGDLDDVAYATAMTSEIQVERPQKAFEFFVKAARAEDARFFQRLSEKQVETEGGTIYSINQKNNVTPVVRVDLSLNVELSQIADRRIAEPIRRRVRQRSLPADIDLCFVAIDNNSGRVLAVIPALRGELDLSRSTMRDLGSVIKPLNSAKALTRGAISANETFADFGPMTFGSEVINNYGNHYAGRNLTIAECLAFSSNVCAMQVQTRLGSTEWRTEIESMNLPLPRSFAKIGIGDNWPVPIIRLASAYTGLRNGGNMAMPTYVSSAVNSDGSRIDNTVTRRQVFTPDACRIVSDGMKRCLTSGTGRGAAGDIADIAWGKTGTTQDSIAVLQTTTLTTVLWIGNRNSNRDLHTTGGALAMKLLSGFLRDAQKRGL
jgi:membrane peptidoglycan carboxypeptidase